MSSLNRIRKSGISLQAVANDNMIYLSNEYVTSKGIQMINSMNALMDLLVKSFNKKGP